MIVSLKNSVLWVALLLSFSGAYGMLQGSDGANLEELPMAHRESHYPTIEVDEDKKIRDSEAARRIFAEAIAKLPKNVGGPVAPTTFNYPKGGERLYWVKPDGTRTLLESMG